jgi:hypothetical protein
LVVWYRVFGLTDDPVDPSALLEHLHNQGWAVAGHFRGDDRGWFRASLEMAEDDGRIEVERYLADEDGIRGELNTWAAWLEALEGQPQRDRLMEHLIGTRQLFTLRQEDGDTAELCGLLCRYLAGRTAGVYQVDGRGFFEPPETLLVAE